MKFKRYNKSAGFSLIEILVAVAILSILTFIAVNSFDGARTKAQAMVTLARSLGDANIQLKNDTGCYVNNTQALFDPTAAQLTANNYCGATFGQQWNRAYLAKYAVDGTGSIQVTKIANQTTAQYATVAGGIGTRYYIAFKNVPMDVLKQALLECNNSYSAQGSFDTNRCMTPTPLTQTTPGEFDYLYDEAR